MGCWAWCYGCLTNSSTVILIPYQKTLRSPGAIIKIFPVHKGISRLNPHFLTRIISQNSANGAVYCGFVETGTICMYKSGFGRGAWIYDIFCVWRNRFEESSQFSISPCLAKSFTFKPYTDPTDRCYRLLTKDSHLTPRNERLTPRHYCSQVLGVKPCSWDFGEHLRRACWVWEPVVMRESDKEWC